MMILRPLVIAAAPPSRLDCRPSASREPCGVLAPVTMNS